MVFGTRKGLNNLSGFVSMNQNRMHENRGHREVEAVMPRSFEVSFSPGLFCHSYQGMTGCKWGDSLRSIYSLQSMQWCFVFSLRNCCWTKVDEKALLYIARDFPIRIFSESWNPNYRVFLRWNAAGVLQSDAILSIWDWRRCSGESGGAVEECGVFKGWKGDYDSRRI